MIAVTDLELRAGSRLLMEHVSFRLTKGDKIGLVGRNGAGKTTLCRVLAGEGIPAAGQVTRTGRIGYLPQDPREVDLATTARDRILSARGLDSVMRKMRSLEGSLEDPVALAQYGKLEERFTALGGYAVESEAAIIAAGVGLPDRVLAQSMGTLSGGQRRRVELARILFSGAENLLLDEPTNHLDADSITWLRDFLRSYDGGFIVISHSVELLDATVTKVFHLDATRETIDQYNVGWTAYLAQREVDERRRKREAANALRQATSLRAQADKMRAKATKAVAAHNMERRADRLMAAVEPERSHDKVAKFRFPVPSHCGKTPLRASGLSKTYGSLEVFTDVDLAIDRGSKVVVLGLNGAGKTTLLRLLARIEDPDTGLVVDGHGLRLGYYAQEHETIDGERTVLENLVAVAPDATETDLRKLLGSFLFSGDTVDQPAGTLSGGEKTRLALALLVTSGANVLLLDEPTNNLDPASREEILAALHRYEGAVILVTHDEGAVEALAPQRVILLPDGVEDIWSSELSDLVALS